MDLKFVDDRFLSLRPCYPLILSLSSQETDGGNTQVMSNTTAFAGSWFSLPTSLTPWM